MTASAMATAMATAIVTAMAMATEMVTATARATAMARATATATATAMAIQGQWLDDGNWTMTMGWLQCDGNGWPATCRMLASAAAPIQDDNQLMWTNFGGWDKREVQFGGIEPQKRVKVESIEWRSIDHHSIDSKSTFSPPQSGKHMGTYSACLLLEVRLCYQRHSKHIDCHRHLCHCCDGVIAVVDAKASPPSLS